ncbi:ribbon-helix-helix protein, CopG family [Pseudomonas aeruginosa]|uniref:ribbon-helix-helix protein, CopG family n=1 Tax=Pseudomonas aeruginosa TaxID=287 RepID=UPI001ABE601E|nr:ribbon-helix-helix protein, CopG family [Pseudomonas aeruginosa]MBO3776615.1 ribbon-helix-helix protein, CopG family [Pseudomonas aeruginosa]
MKTGFTIEGESQDDELSNILKNSKHLSKRETIWLWLYANRNSFRKLNPATCNGSTMRDEIAKSLRTESYAFRNLLSDMDNSLLPDLNFKWLKNEELQNYWLETRPLDIPPLPNGLVHLTGKDRTIARVDAWDIDICEKEKALETIKQDWASKTNNDDATFKWFNQKEESLARCKHAEKWLKKNEPNFFQSRSKINNYKELLMAFEEAQTSISERQSIVKKIQNSWYKRSDTGKRQLNVTITEATISLLEELLEELGKSKSEIVEELINKEYENRSYLYTQTEVQSPHTATPEMPGIHHRSEPTTPTSAPNDNPPIGSQQEVSKRASQRLETQSPAPRNRPAQRFEAAPASGIRSSFSRLNKPRTPKLTSDEHHDE